MNKVLELMGYKPLYIAFAFISLLIFFRQNTVLETWLLYSLFYGALYFDSLEKRPLRFLWSLVIMGGVITLFWYLASYVALLVGVLVLFAIYRIVKDIRRKDKSLYMTGLRDIETRLFSKPLDKKEWKK